MFTSFLNPLAIIMSLSTLLGVLVHDTRIDKVTSVALTAPALTSSYDANTKGISFATDLHTHVERTSVGHAIDFSGHNLLVKPRDDDKKYATPKHVTRGHHAFDNYNLPIVS
jgi:hypothetical protein